MPDAYLVGGARTPVGRYGGALAASRPDDLAALVLRAAAARSGAPDDAFDEVILGAANQAGEDNRNVARLSTLLAGLPDDLPGYTVNRLCASGMTAVAGASQAVRAGDADLIIAGGVESMTRAPWVQAKPSRAWAKPGDQFDTSIGWRFTNPVLAARDKATFSMPETAEEVARLDSISREDADAFAVRSHARAVAAIDAGRFADEIIAVDVDLGRGRRATVTTDEGPRRDTNLETLAGLRPVVPGGEVVTAGNSSTLNDGASALVVASAAAIERYGLTPRARIVSHSSAALAPEIMGLGPVPASEKALARAGLTADDIGSVELNEAFATQSLATIRRLGLDEERVNADGGAIALGHPLGSSGSRLLVTLLGRMERESSRYGLATMCVGVGQGTAMILERV
ncbi:acetyl-CoA C-acyltransferase [Microbacterium sp. G2-8]|uniref:thiolase family protein n=1 Tax=Microbacterium sp. G2-8 TaxID=2842454 RepID=UPI001C8A64F4|nr:acetyl-CoA C-acyltransferase [Microbacterium sp. G2-8]